MRNAYRVLILVLVLALALAPGVLAQGQKVSIIEAWFIHNESMGDPVGVVDHAVRTRVIVPPMWATSVVCR
ncbi:MAG: hypothetical protein HYU43_00470 [Armatimonadetes bacterium]|nr:hypothetical protein [Armatimonadota bacterium]